MFIQFKTDLTFSLISMFFCIQIISKLVVIVEFIWRWQSVFKNSCRIYGLEVLYNYCNINILINLGYLFFSGRILLWQPLFLVQNHFFTTVISGKSLRSFLFLNPKLVSGAYVLVLSCCSYFMFLHLQYFSEFTIFREWIMLTSIFNDFP